jgi:hypothetical protein
MKKNPTKPGSPPPTDAEVEEIVHTTLRDTAKLFPRSSEEIEILESELEGTTLPQANPQKLLKMLRGELPKPNPKLAQTESEPLLEVTENLALAARKGTKISKETREIMDADRAAAESAPKHSKNRDKTI